MKKKLFLLIFKIILAIFIGIFIPLLIGLKLRADGNYKFFIIITSALTALLFIINLDIIKIKAIKKIIKTLLKVIYAISPVIILGYIVIIPYEAYMAWLQLIKKNLPSGSISFLYIIGLSYFSTLSAGLIYKYGIIKPLLGFLSILFLFFTIIIQNNLITVLTTIIIVFSILIISYNRWDKKYTVMLSSIKIVIIAVILAIILSINKPPNTGWLVDRRLLPGLNNLIKSSLPGAPVLSSVGSFGTYNEESKLGYKPLINSPVFEVNGMPGEKIYLRTEVFENYTGLSWQHNPKIIKASKNKNINKKDINNNNNIPIVVKTLIDYCNLIPHTLDTYNIHFKNSRIPDLVYGCNDTGYKLSLPVIKNTNFILQRNTVNINTNKDYIYNDPSPYLEVPVTLPDSVENLAKSFEENEIDKKSILKNIQKYLSANYKYSLNVKAPKEEEDFIDKFLFKDKKGFCQHFASSFVILARLNNIPARYVSGYLIYIPLSSRKAQCTTMDAHAWAEVWFPDTGWIIWEATPPMLMDNYGTNSLLSLRNIEDDILTAKQLRAIFNIKTHKKRFKFNNILIWKIIYFSLMIIILFLIIFFIILFIKKINFNLKGNDKKMFIIINRLLKKTDKHGILPPNKTGWIKWGDNIKEKYPNLKKQIDRFLIIINKIYFSKYNKTKKDIYYLKIFYKKINNYK